MVMVVHSPDVEEIDGKLGGTNFRSDVCGKHIQRNPRKVISRSKKAEKHRAKWGTVCHFCAHDENVLEHVDCWVEYSINHPQKNKKGDTVFLWGYQTCIKFNMKRMKDGKTLAYCPKHDPGL